MSDELERELPEREIDITLEDAKQTGPVNFLTTIARLEKRAAQARKRSRWAVGLLMFGAYGMSSFIAYNLLPSYGDRFGTMKYAERNVQLEKSGESVKAVLAHRVRYAVEQLIGPDNELQNRKTKFIAPDVKRSAVLKAEMKDALVDFEKAARIAEIEKTKVAESPVRAISIPIVSTAVFSFGVIGIMIFLIQISVMFIKYHLRLAELYDAQADALRASGGDTSLAFSLLKLFSPNAVEVGKTPGTLYEKALDAILAVAKRQNAAP